MIKKNRLSLFNSLKKISSNTDTATTSVIFIIILLLGAYVFYLRYPYNYLYANFYAEDGRVFMYNILQQGDLTAMFSMFNGYLMVGVYIVGSIGKFLNSLFGHGFQSLAQYLSVASYLFWGAICALPLLLFRRKLGLAVSLLAVLLLWLTPMGGWDYAVFGTIGNLKYAFVFVAAMLVVFRNDTSLANKTWHFILTDIIFLICLLTNMIVAALVPLLLIRYKDDIIRLIKSRKISISRDKISLVLLVMSATVYVGLIILHGLTSISGYLDGPLDKSAIPTILYRGSIYGLIYPITPLLNEYLVAFMFIIAISVMLTSKYRTQLSILAYVLIANTLGFVYNRPGVTSMFLNFDDKIWPGHFFYAGTMIFVFGVVYIYRNELGRLMKRSDKPTLLLSLVFLIYFMALSSGSHYDFNRMIMKRPTLVSEVQSKCATTDSLSDLTLDIYPSKDWTMIISREKACSESN